MSEAQTHPNVYGKARTVAQLREEADALARLHSQVALAEGDGPRLRSVARRLMAAERAYTEARA